MAVVCRGPRKVSATESNAAELSACRWDFPRLPRDEVTIDDPIAYEEPFTGTLTFRLRDFELSEFICQELMLSQLPEMRPDQE